MSVHASLEPECLETSPNPDIATIVDVRSTTIDGFPVGRVLPSVKRRSIGPFVFLDHIGPVDVEAGRGLDVRPHPHIHLATVTYLFDGAILHRDSLGSHQVIEPGAVNWMTAGRGIVHSERTPEALRESGFRLHGVQLWVALPTEQENIEPAFEHYPAESLPDIVHDGAHVRVLAGEAFGVTSPIRSLSRVLFVEVRLPAGTSIELPKEQEVAAFIVSGKTSCGAQTAETGRLLAFTSGSHARLHAQTDTRLLFIGGDPLGPRHMFWNFVSSSAENIERAKRDWQSGNFPKVPGDEREFVPLPETRHK